MFTIQIIATNGEILLSDLFFMDSLTELHQKLSFLVVEEVERTIKNGFSIQISSSERTVIETHFQSLEEVQLNKTKIYEQIIQKQHEYIAQHQG